jgi:uncharacterized membrane protein
MSTPKAVFIALVALAVAQAIFYYPQLPGTVASHFDGAGQPNGWSSKTVFFGVMFGMMAMMGLVFLGIPKAISRVPDNIISLPYRDHWLAKERRDETMRFIASQLSWFGVATLLLMVATTQFTIDANLRNRPELPTKFMWAFWAYMGFSAAWTVHFIGHFCIVRKHQSTA